MSSKFKGDVIRHLQARHGALHDFWTGSQEIPDVGVEAHCDVVYALYLLGEGDSISPTAVSRFLAYVSGLELPGWKSRTGSARKISVHNCAYLFGALNLLRENPSDLYDAVLDGRTPLIREIVDEASSLPIYPRKWIHHNWRVSHWLGGVPSILLSLEGSGSELAKPFQGLARQVRNALDAVISPTSGLIRAYRSQLLQSLFRAAYRLRHDPDLGDVGGIAHILWVDHALGREYVAGQALYNQASHLFNAYAPFMEQVPYCLDFDIVQIVRTAGEQLNAHSNKNALRAESMMRSIEEYFVSPGDNYTLHKVPGALATYHECAFVSGKTVSFAGSGAPIDVIKRANWL